MSKEKSKDSTVVKNKAKNARKALRFFITAIALWLASALVSTLRINIVNLIGINMVIYLLIFILVIVGFIFGILSKRKKEEASAAQTLGYFGNLALLILFLILNIRNAFRLVEYMN